MKKNLLIILATCLTVSAILFIYLPVFERQREIANLKDQAKYLIKQVELYKERNHKLPEYTENMNLNLPDDYPLNYTLERGNKTYVISFQIGFFKSMVYHSENKQWAIQY